MEFWSAVFHSHKMGKFKKDSFTKLGEQSLQFQVLDLENVSCVQVSAIYQK